MAHTIFILGTDPQECKQLREILEQGISDSIVAADLADNLPRIKESDTVIITSEEKNAGILYRRLLRKLEEQVHRAELLSELIRLFSSSLKTEELLDRIVSKSTQVVADTSFIVLAAESGEIRLESAYSTDPGRLAKILIAMVNLGGQTLAQKLLADVLQQRKTIVIPKLQDVNVSPELRNFIEKYSVTSVLAVPIQTKEVVLGALIALSGRPFNNEDVNTALALADFTATALENAVLFAELQRSAITDSLTGVYNPRFFHEVLGRETARADRYTAPLSLLMIDVDGFKEVNDTYGHIVGNKVLTQIAKIIEHSVRNTDVVFRCGGDEFGVVLPGTDIEGAMRAAEKILNKVSSAAILAGLGYSGLVTVSIGLSEHRRGSYFETLVAEADQALYASKRASKNTFRAFSASSLGQEEM